MGSYKILGDHEHVHMARAVNNVTLHALNKDSLNNLRVALTEFRNEIQKAKEYVETTTDPIISFGNLRGDMTLIQLFKLTVTKILKINRDFKEAGVQNGMNKMLAKMNLSADRYTTIEGLTMKQSDHRLTKHSEALTAGVMQAETNFLMK